MQYLLTSRYCILPLQSRSALHSSDMLLIVIRRRNIQGFVTVRWKLHLVNSEYNVYDLAYTYNPQTVDLKLRQHWDSIDQYEVNISMIRSITRVFISSNACSSCIRCRKSQEALFLPLLIVNLCYVWITKSVIIILIITSIRKITWHQQQLHYIYA